MPSELILRILHDRLLAEMRERAESAEKAVEEALQALTDEQGDYAAVILEEARRAVP